MSITSSPKILKTLNIFLMTSWVNDGGQDSSWYRYRAGPSFQKTPKEEKGNRFGRLFAAESMIVLISKLVLMAVIVERRTFRFLKMSLTGFPYFWEMIRSASLTLEKTLGKMSLLTTPSAKAEESSRSWVMRL